MSDDSPTIERELTVLEADLKRLEAEYQMFFSGRLPRPPWETRNRVDAMVKRLDRTHVANYGSRFRFSALQTRYAKFIDLWDRALRAREEGRPGPFRQPPKSVAERPKGAGEKLVHEQLVHTATFKDPMHEMDKLHDLYNRLAEARRHAGQEDVPFHRFADLVKKQVRTLQENGETEVSFRVAMKDGKVALTARKSKDE